jgi:hypothetical protein
MVEKVDRPEAPAPYVVREAKQTKEDRHQQHNPREDAEREQRKQIEGKEWSKFGRQSAVIKSLRVPRERIARFLYRGATLHSGIGTLMVDVAWKDGRLTRGALMLITRLEDFMRLRKLRPGEQVPEGLWAKGPTVELGIIQRVKGGGGFPGRDIGGRKVQEKQVQAPEKFDPLRSIGIVDGKGKTNWGLVLLYAFLIALAVMAVIIMVV